MPERRPMGSLEAEVLACLWSHTEALTPADVKKLLGMGLAYTTIATILARLCEKGLIERERAGRVFRYRPKVTEADYAAQRMQAALATTSDRAATLHRFVGALSPRDAAELRRLVDELGKAPDQ